MVVNTKIPTMPIDYLVIGHISLDDTKHGFRLGGTAAYAALTVSALGLRAGIVTSWGEEVDVQEFRNLPIHNIHSTKSTVFENRYQGNLREQIIHRYAKSITYHDIPEVWRCSEIVHLGPIANEVENEMASRFRDSLVGVTPQGWFRDWDENGNVFSRDWKKSKSVLKHANAIVISPEDVNFDEERIEEIVNICPVVAVTEAEAGARLYWHGDVRRFRAPAMQEIDPTGAGDIFAAAFLVRLKQTRDPWGAARFATNISAFSVQRSGLDSIPTSDEIKLSMVEVL